MSITENREDGCVILTVSGEIDGTNVDEFEEKLAKAGSEADELVLELGGLVYISSAVLRSFHQQQKTMQEQGKRMVLRHVTKEVMDIFTVTGFVRLLEIEES
ncbi:MAG: STAS domain-containing protein [Lachnospiraceae bacterium]|nr:STAS domain-containing protein [Lachnospiraceae bacterium]